MQRRPLVLAGLTLALASSHSSLFAQTASLVVPDLTESDGIANASTGQPWKMDANDCRIQHMYAAGDFPYDTPMTITRLRWRPRDYTSVSTTWTGATYQMEIRMSTSARTPETMSDTYASNIGTDELLVHSGPVQLTAGVGNNPGPSAPYVDLLLSTPFVYDPSQGSLLIDFVSDGAQFSGGTTYFPAVDRFGQANASRVWSYQTFTSPTGTLEHNCGLVMDFDFTFAGTHCDFYADELGAPLGTAIDFQDRSITDAVGGITSWAWDFDGNGTTDSTSQNPSHVYAAPGLYTVSLTVASAGGSDTSTRTGYIVIGDPAASVPDLLQYQFNDVRGATAANTASGTMFPSEGTVSDSGWQTGPGAGREGFGPNEAGFGVLASTGTNDTNYVDTGAGLTISGSLTMSWWQKMDATAPSNAWAFAFGGPGATFTAYNRGGAYKSIVFVSDGAAGSLLCLKDLHHPDWVHLCLVIDDTAGTVTWYVDGEPAGSKSYPAGTHVLNNTQFFVGRNDGTATHARYFTHDDFRVYGRALSYGEVLGTMAGENASASRYGTECWAFGAIPTIDPVGRPSIGNSAFRVEFHGGAANGDLPLLAPIGFFAASGQPAPLGAAFACGNLETSVDLFATTMTDASGDAALAVPVPNLPAFAGLHAYTQFVSVLGTTRGLDLNLQMN